MGVPWLTWWSLIEKQKLPGNKTGSGATSSPELQPQALGPISSQPSVSRLQVWSGVSVPRSQMIILFNLIIVDIGLGMQEVLSNYKLIAFYISELRQTFWGSFANKFPIPRQWFNGWMNERYMWNSCHNTWLRFCSIRAVAAGKLRLRASVSILVSLVHLHTLCVRARTLL